MTERYVTSLVGDLEGQWEEWQIHYAIEGETHVFVYSPDRQLSIDPEWTAEGAARSMVRLIERMADEGGPRCTDGPHLAKRTVTRTTWEPAE